MRPTPGSVEHIKDAALRLFAQRGVDGVTVRQIAEAAGQKNHASVAYHFGSKEELVRAVIIHGAQLIDDLRCKMLAGAEAAGGPHSVLEVVRLMVYSSLPTTSPPWCDRYNQFVVTLQLSNRALFMDALDNRWNSGYLRCLNHIRRLKPDVPLSIMNKRMIFMGAALGGVLASREQELSDTSREHPTWSDSETLDHAIQSLAAMLDP